MKENKYHEYKDGTHIYDEVEIKKDIINILVNSNLRVSDAKELLLELEATLDDWIVVEIYENKTSTKENDIEIINKFKTEDGQEVLETKDNMIVIGPKPNTTIDTIKELLIKEVEREARTCQQP